MNTIKMIDFHTFHTFYTFWIFLVAVISMYFITVFTDEYYEFLINYYALPPYYALPRYYNIYIALMNYNVNDHLPLLLASILILFEVFVLYVLRIIGFCKNHYVGLSTLRTMINVMSAMIFVVIDFKIINYNFYYCMLYLLKFMYVVCFLQIAGVVKTRKWPTLITTFNVILSMIYIVQFVFACTMINVYIKGYDYVKYNLINSARNALLMMFIGTCIAYIIKLILIIMSVVLCCINNKKNCEYYTNYIYQTVSKLFKK